MPAKRKVGNIISVGAPIGGWNVRDPLPAMNPLFAPIMDNCFCLPSEIQVRRGWQEHATFTGTCETLMPYDSTNGTTYIFAAVNNGVTTDIYDVTSPGAVGTAEVSGLSNARFKYSHAASGAGQYSYFVNAEDDALIYDGTTFQAVNSSSTPFAITGIATSSFSDVINHKRRLWFVEKGSMNCWYLPTDQVGGAAVKYNFGPVFARGGFIVKVDTWSLDAGAGLDDHFVVTTSEGEVAVYSGTDPASASTWQLVGVFLIGSPTGNGRTCKYGGDLLLINKDGIAQMSKSLMSSRVNTQLQLTDKIQPQLAQDAIDYAANHGWDIVLFPPANMLLVNIPLSDGNSYQYVMNTISGGWARWTNIPAKTWLYANEKIYWGGKDVVGQGWFGQSDNGSPVVAEILPAYQNFGSGSQLMRWTLGRILLGTSSNFTYGARIEVDFDLRLNEVAMPFIEDLPVAIYGTSEYGDSVYGGTLTVKKRWQNLSGMGYWGSLHMKFETTYADVRIYSYDMMIEAGGNI